MVFRLQRRQYFFSETFFRGLMWSVIFAAAVLLLLWWRGGLSLRFACMVVLLLLGGSCIRPLFLPKELRLEKDELLFHTYLPYRRQDHSAGVWVRVRGISISHRSVNVVMRRVTRIEYTLRSDHRVGTLRVYGEMLAMNRHGDPIEGLQVPSCMHFVGVEDLPRAVEALHRAYPTASCEKKEKLRYLKGQ